MSEYEGLKSLFVEPREITVGNHKVSVNTISLGGIPAIASVMKKIMALIPMFQEVEGDSEKNKKKKNESKVSAILDFVEKDFDSVVIVLKETTSLKEDEIRKLNLAASTFLFSEAIKENSDFFVKHVAPAFAKAAASVKAVKAKAVGQE